MENGVYVTDGNGLILSHIDAGRIWWHNPQLPIVTNFRDNDYNPEPFRFEKVDDAMSFAKLLRKHCMGGVKTSDVVCI